MTTSFATFPHRRHRDTLAQPGVMRRPLQQEGRVGKFVFFVILMSVLQLFYFFARRMLTPTSLHQPGSSPRILSAELAAVSLRRPRLLKIGPTATRTRALITPGVTRYLWGAVVRDVLLGTFVVVSFNACWRV